MKIGVLLITLTLAISLTNCSSDSEDNSEIESQDPPVAESETGTNEEPETESEDSDEMVLLLKSFTRSFLDNFYANRYYQYENDFIVRYDYNDETTDYSYDDVGRLISTTNGITTFEYEYDDQNRVIQMARRNSNNDIDRYTYLVYENDIVTITVSQPNVNTEYVYIQYLDENKRIIKIETDNGIGGNFKLREYVYDEQGNIVTEILKNSETLEDRINTYTYTNMINPFYIAHKKLNQSIYHLTNLAEIDIYTLYGTTPNVILREGYDYTSGEDNYPTELNIDDGTGVNIWLFEYY